MDLAKKIREVSELKGEFLLRSGKKSDTYFDKYMFEAFPNLLMEIVTQMKPLIPEGTQVLCGLEMGGIPIATLLSQITNLPAGFIRKKAKEYGTCKYAEGYKLVGKQILLIEDVVSSGGAIIDVSKMLRSDNIEVHTALCVIDRQTGGKENLSDVGIELLSLFSSDQIK